MEVQQKGVGDGKLSFSFNTGEEKQRTVRDTLFVFEAPIDLLSFLSATGDGWETHHYISLGGVSEKALMQYLADHKNIRKIYLCLDNDTAGNAACEKRV